MPVIPRMPSARKARARIIQIALSILYYRLTVNYYELLRVFIMKLSAFMYIQMNENHLKITSFINHAPQVLIDGNKVYHSF